MTKSMKEALREEIEFIDGLLEYEDTDEMYDLHTIEEASEESINLSYDHGEEFPEALTNPETFLLVWNYCLGREKVRKEKIKREQYQAQYAKDHPDFLQFSGYYNEPDVIAFLDPDDLAHCLRYHGCYDAAHVNLVLDAVRAWADRK